MKKIFYIPLFLLLITTIAGCEKFESSPHQVFDNNTPRNINQHNIDKLLATTTTNDTLRIIFTGDSQRYYDEAESLVKKVNSMKDIDFLIVAGDISDFGLRQEFEWMNNIFSGLHVPYVSVIGNHDVIGNGQRTYEYMFGHKDFSFVYKHTKFIFHNTNSREYSFNGQVPNMNWLTQQCQPEAGVSYIIPVSHVPPYDGDFDKNLEQQYAKTLRNTPGLLISLHGHHHHSTDKYPYEDGVRYLNSNAVDKRLFMLLEIYNGEVHKTPISY
ncbi:MAG: metallophosphoesterase [Bacteroidota bacterium]